MSTYSASRRVNDPDHSLNGRLGAIIGVLYLGYRGSLVLAQKFGYDQFPLTASIWRTKHSIPHMAPPLLAEEEGPPT
jgi:hypothetical protein